MKVLRGQRNQCQGCKEYFNSNYAFDKHRVGQHGVDRRCMIVDEMKSKGMSLNSAGFWVGSVYEKYKGIENESNEEIEEHNDQQETGKHTES